MSNAAPTLLLLSERASDTELFTQVAAMAGLTLHATTNITDFVKIFASNTNTIVAWDADHPNGHLDTHSYPHKAVKYVLMKAVPPQHTFAITDQLINLYPEDPKFPFLVKYPQNNIIRRNLKTSAFMYSQVMKQFMAGKYLDFLGFSEKEPKIQSIKIDHSQKRHAAVEAVQNFLSKAQIEERLAAKLAQATDELLMNSIFDAATDNTGYHIRNLLPRTTELSLEGRDAVQLDAFLGEKICGICVTDNFGSVDQGRVLECLKQNYKIANYTVKTTTTGAGLGLYNIVQSGVSLLISFIPGKQTKAMIFFPHVRSHKDFRNAFQFTGVIKVES